LKGAPEIGHIALLYKVGEKFMVIDPAGLYLTDVSYTLKTSFKKNLGEETVYLNPLWINPNLKLLMIKEGVAELQPVHGSSIEPKPAEEAHMAGKMGVADTVGPRVVRGELDILQDIRLNPRVS